MMAFAVDLEKFKAGERKTFDRVYKHYSRQLHHFALSYVHNQEIAEELVSDSLLKLWRNRHNIKTISQIKAFLFIVTKNTCIDNIRSNREHHHISLDDIDLEVQEPDVLNRIIYTELLQRIETEVNKLSESQQQIFRKSFFEGKSTAEIAEETGMNVASIFSQKSKAVATLRGILKENMLFLLLLAQHYRN